MQSGAQAIQQLMMMLLLLLSGAIFAIVFHFMTIEEPEEKHVFYCGVVYDPRLAEYDGEIPGNHKNGELLFIQTCACCHATDMRRDLTGPALGGVYKRWNKDTSKLFAFIKNSQDYLANKNDKYAQELYQKFDKTEMMAFDSILSSEEILDVLAYIDWKYRR